MFDIALYQPEIPPNTGNIIRLCANFGNRLHLIEPLGFELDNKRLRRAGLDYKEWAGVERHSDYASFIENTRPQRIWALTTKARQCLHQVDFAPGDMLLFGPETRGLPADILQDITERYWLRIPMQPQSRSLNLSNAAAIACYEVWRQLNFAGGR